MLKWVNLRILGKGFWENSVAKCYWRIMAVISWIMVVITWSKTWSSITSRVPKTYFYRTTLLPHHTPPHRTIETANSPVRIGLRVWVLGNLYPRKVVLIRPPNLSPRPGYVSQLSFYQLSGTCDTFGGGQSSICISYATFEFWVCWQRNCSRQPTTLSRRHPHLPESHQLSL